jgi:hypothetical protein
LIIARVRGIIEDSNTLAMICSLSEYSRYFKIENQAKKQPNPFDKNLTFIFYYLRNIPLDEKNYRSTQVPEII